ncbi:hypothetical protein Q4530_08200 [Colwellia sp. 1_MG-2023]|nr:MULTISPECIES: hypothetical protein [unclassified Colwellia]MBU2924833.1 hypothetical protein [Colwellia sp. C2M11]MDO6654067.1 hypothetical protein [Colwellia sp. 3_MG-2023]MDO6665485.1 hypothetical protein [Colwellia sp. 2_MG-2023]MDO6689756.1 hypothetical protein [Colwellia sp. 1_MG-2023]
MSCQHQLVLGQIPVDRETNEIIASPELLAMLDIEIALLRLMRLDVIQT